jgi:hypothetical protein
MALGRFFRSFIDKEALGEEMIAAIHRMYQTGARLSPDVSPHALLASVWTNRMKANGMAGRVDTEALDDLAWLETQDFACLPYPGNIRALGLYFITKERPDIIAEHPRFGILLTDLRSLLDAPRDAGALHKLYSTLNPDSNWQCVANAERFGFGT